MNHTPYLVSFVLVVLLLAAFTAGEVISSDDSVRAVPYRGVPLPLDLRLNEETRIHVGESVEIGVPPAIAANLQASSIHGIVYLTATQAFTRQRLVLKGSQSGRFVLLDVAASTDAAVVNDLHVQTGRLDTTPASPPSLTPAQLLRYVAQLTLAPLPSTSELSQIRRTSVTLRPNTIYRDLDVASSVLAAWHTDEWLALAIELQNEGENAIRLNPNDVDGVWHTAGFTHARLLSRGKRGAQSVMFLVGTHDAIAELRR